MRRKLLSCIIWPLLLSQVASRPRETEPVPGTLPVSKRPDEDARSRYLASNVLPRNLNEFYTKLYNGGFTPGIISSLKHPFAHTQGAHSPHLPPSRSNQSTIPSKPSHHALKRPKPAITERAFIPIIRSKNSGQRLTTKSPIAAKNRVVIKPSIFPSPASTHDHPSTTTKISTKSKSTTQRPTVSTPHQKTWPNTPPQDLQDLYNYDKYTTNSLTKKPIKSKPPRPNSNKTAEVTPSHSTRRPPTSTITTTTETLTQPNVQEIIQWLQIPAFTSTVNESYLMQDVKPGQTISNTFSPVFDPNRPLLPIAGDDVGEDNWSDEGLNDFYLPEIPPRPLEDLSSAKPPQKPLATESVTVANALSTLYSEGPLTDRPDAMIPKRPSFRPISEISQNTVVHILNPMSKRPNVTVSEGQFPMSTLKPPPNVHIMFMTQNNTDSTKNAEPTFQQNSDCPIITINSITKVNNTIQSKEGCTDLNIVINSQLLSTNNFGPAVDLDEAGSDKYAEGPLTPTDYSTIYSSSPGSLSSYYSTSGAGEPDRDALYGAAVEEERPEGGSSSSLGSSALSGSPGSPNYDVNQDTTIEYGSESNPAPAGFSESSNTLSAQPGPNTAEPAVEAPFDTSPARPAVLPAVVQGAETANGPGIGGANTALHIASALAGPALTAVSSVGDLDDDDDYDFDFDMDMDFDLSPSRVMDGVSSVFTYFTFLNPINYGIFSFIAAPFAALAAGILGIAAISFPYAFTGIRDFGRSLDGGLKLKPNLEVVVKQSIHDYRHWQEWKSKRKKRRR